MSWCTKNKKTCFLCDKNGTVNTSTIPCPYGGTLKLENTEIPNFQIVTKMTGKAIQSEAKKISDKHFVKEILPDLSPDDQALFKK